MKETAIPVEIICELYILTKAYCIYAMLIVCNLFLSKWKKTFVSKRNQEKTFLLVEKR